MNPAFHLGKIELALDEENPDTVFIGFSVEKGFGRDVTGKKSEVMQPNWFWHDFVRLCNVPLAGAVEQANEAAGSSVQIQVGSGMPNSNPSIDRLTFEAQEGRLSQSKYKPGDGLLSELAGSDSFEAFADRIRALDGARSQWHWIGVTIGTAFTLDPDGEDDTDLCAAMLQPFRSWMRSAKGR